MREHRWWIGWLGMAILLVLLLVAWNQRRECERERARLADELVECKGEVDAQRTQTDAERARAETCERNLAAQCANCGHTPPPGPIIDITPNPNSGGTYVSLNGTPAQPQDPSGDTLNAKAFGALMQFKADFVLNGESVERSLRSAKVTFPSGDVLEILKEGDYPGVFTWKLNGTTLAPVPPSPDHAWRTDLCATAPAIEVEYMIPGGGTGTAIAQKLTLQAFNL